VTVRGTADGFVVADDGPGLPPAVADSLFGGRFDADRRGLGLLVVERVVSGHGWHGAVDPEADGTRIVVSGVGAEGETPAPACPPLRSRSDPFY
jgi:signal transduction histidine kinase